MQEGEALSSPWAMVFIGQSSITDYDDETLTYLGIHL